MNASDEIVILDETIFFHYLLDISNFISTFDRFFSLSGLMNSFYFMFSFSQIDLNCSQKAEGK